MSTPTSKFEYDTYVVNVSNTPILSAEDMTAMGAALTTTDFIPKFASLAIKNATTGVAAPATGETADVYVQMYTFKVREADSSVTPAVSAAYALVGFVAYNNYLKFGVVSFNSNKQVDNINFYRVVGDGMNQVKATESALGVQSGTNVIFGVTTSGESKVFMLPPKSFFLDGIHVNPFEPFPAVVSTGLACFSTDIIGLKASA